MENENGNSLKAINNAFFSLGEERIKEIINEVADKVEVRTEKVPTFYDYNPNWILTKDYNPDMGTFNCITERVVPDTVKSFEPIAYSYEICYFNRLMEKFQDKNNEIVKVIAWTSIPDFDWSLLKS